MRTREEIHHELKLIRDIYKEKLEEGKPLKKELAAITGVINECCLEIARLTGELLELKEAENDCTQKGSS